MKTTKAFDFLTHESEKIEYQQAVEGLGLILAKAVKPRILLKRTFNQSDFKGGFIRYWRVMSPESPFFQSDISVMWLEEQGYIS